MKYFSLYTVAMACLKLFTIYYETRFFRSLKDRNKEEIRSKDKSPRERSHRVSL